MASLSTDAAATTASSPATEDAQRLAELQKVSDDIVRDSPIYSFICQDLKLVSVRPDLVRAVLPLSAHHLNSRSILHGSTTATLVDWCGGLAILARDPTSKRGVSVDIHVSYLGAARLGQELVIHAWADKVGRTMAFVRVEFWARPKGSDERGNLVATGSHTKHVG